MKWYIKMSIPLMLAVLMLAALTLGVSAAGTDARDGLEVTLLTDQGTYAADEEIQLSVSVKNTNAYAVEGVRVEALLPEGFELVGEAPASLDIPAGQTGIASMPVRLAGNDSSISIPWGIWVAAGLLLVAVACLCVAVWALFFRETVVLTPDYAPQQEEVMAETIPDDSGEKMEQPQGGGSVSLTYAREVTIDLAGETASLYFANPGRSNQDIVLQIVIQDTVVVQSGTLKPGNQVSSLSLLSGAKNQLAAGVYNGKFNVLYYDPVSGEKAIVNTGIPITITVK